MIRRAILAACIVCVAVSAAAAETLRGGSTATLTMSVDRLPAHADEWEAFLSLDGGAHYTIRITPHLDLRLRQVTWVVPNVDAAEARLMIRVGDEHEETSYELPERFAIARDASAPLPPRRAAPSTHAEEGVVAWAEGDRAGTRVTLVTETPAPSGMDSVRRAGTSDDTDLDAPKKLAVTQLAAGINQFARQHPNIPTSQHPNPKDILLLSTRMNV